MSFSKETLEYATRFFLGERKEFNKKDKIDQEIFLKYISDCNSSSIREAVTLYYLKYDSYNKKHGFDGIDNITGRQKEAKPRFFNANQKVKLGGNFNDMTIALLEKKKDADIICSSFLENDLVFIVEFPMSDIYQRLQIPIINAKVGRRVVCSFSHMDILHSTELKIHFYNHDLVNKKKCLSKSLEKFLREKYDQQFSKQKKLNKKSV